MQSLSDEQQVQPRDVDKILNEITAVMMRISAYRRFIYANLNVSIMLYLRARFFFTDGLLACGVYRGA